MKFLFTILSLTFLLSCSESYKLLDPKAFNEQIVTRTDIRTPEALIMFYYNYPEEEGPQNIMIESGKLNDNSYEITLVHEGIGDDSQAAEKIIMKAELNGQTWRVIEIKKKLEVLEWQRAYRLGH
jgi:hypothetical protein